MEIVSKWCQIRLHIQSILNGGNLLWHLKGIMRAFKPIDIEPPLRKEKMNLRAIPHPEHGNYCGLRRRCETKNHADHEGDACPMPVDEVDGVCLLHDGDTSVFADWKFAWRMLTINPLNKDNYEKPIYSRAYQYGSAFIIFGTGLVSVPLRAIKKLL